MAHVCQSVFTRLGAPVAFHRAMKLLSDFVEDKDAIFSSCPASPNQISRQTASMARDTASDLSDSTLAGHANFLEEEAMASNPRPVILFLCLNACAPDI